MMGVCRIEHNAALSGQKQTVPEKDLRCILLLSGVLTFGTTPTLGLPCSTEVTLINSPLSN